MLKFLLLAFWLVGLALVVVGFFAQAEAPKIVMLIIGTNMFTVGFCADYLSDKIDDLIAALRANAKQAATQDQPAQTEK